jgi:hypothetical protein
MFEVEVTYLSKLGKVQCNFTTSQRVGTHEEANELRALLRNLPALANASIKIKSGGPPTVDEALERILKSMREYPPEV